MALMETKIVQVDNTPERINGMNEAFALFGWNVLSIQVTHSQDTRTYTKGFLDAYTGDKTVETTTINYATITYQRDKHMKNYAELCELEKEYDELVDSLPDLNGVEDPNKPGIGALFKNLNVIEWIFVIGVGVFTAIGFIFVIPYLIIRYNLLKKTCKEKDEQWNKIYSRIDVIKEKANELTA